MTTMNEKYGDGSEHEACNGCGYCKTCGDCQCGPDFGDGHDCEGFPGGCERFGCPGGEKCTAKVPNAGVTGAEKAQLLERQS